ncbi:class I adenylate-forming enzyme family protein [Saccharospirillum impatiens]|uniref:class I adenylate-forming enzyme family protein n=1 Tax=Saccharospirillum impatiens TaxID=169438 RepID=UPI00041C5C00|nr:class I adenylate-forming enzyme family protein [Saccharospirillum impatiens]
MTLSTERWAGAFNRQPALKDVDSGEVWSFQVLHTQVLSWAVWLSKQGLQRGDRVLWLARNRIEFFALLLACHRQGWVLVPMNWRESIEVLHLQNQLIAPRLVVYEAAFESVAISLQREAGAGLLELNSRPDLQRDDLPEASEAGADEPWYLLFTSGTTGIPKAVIYSPGMALANAANVRAAMSLDHADVTASVLPHYHTAGINLFALPLLMQGGSVRVYARFDPEAFMADIIGQQVTVLLLVPTQFRRLTGTRGFANTPSLEGCARVLATGGGPIDRQVLHDWAGKGAAVRNGCGMTESGPTLFFQTDAEAREAPGCVGQPMPLSEIRLIGPHGDAVTDGQTGEVWVRGPAVTPGYWRNESANQLAFYAGWYRSGDLALREPQTGQYRIVDRVTDMYICGGENVFPAEVEQVLLQHRGVEDAAIAGEHDPTWGETGVAFIVLKPGDRTTQEDMQYFARQRLAPYKVPHRWVFLEALPKTPTGKVRRSRIRSWLRSPPPLSTL